MAKTVWLCGAGAVGGQTLLLLAQREGIDRIVLSGRDEALGQFKARVAALGSVIQGLTRTCEFVKNDVRDLDATARLLDRIKPDVVLLALSTHAPGFIGTMALPRDVHSSFAVAGFGAQLPWHLLLPARFMQALAKSGVATQVINASFPDVVNPALWKHFGFGPTVGVGNIDNLAARIIERISVAEGVAVGEVHLSFIGSHALAAHGATAGVPYFLKIYVAGRDVTERHDINALLLKPASNQSLASQLSHTWPYTNHLTAASAAKTILAILHNSNQYTQAAAPNGLIGGYSVRLNARGAEVILPEGLSLEAAVQINQAAERFDGIERIEADGTVVYTDKTYLTMKSLGYDCKALTFDALDARASELELVLAKLRKLQEMFGLHHPTSAHRPMP